MSAPKKALDLRGPAPKKERIELKEAPLYSPEWAKTVKPIALSLLGLIALVILLPFGIVFWAAEEKVDNALDWAKTVLPPVVGFGGALVGYYFGTRGSQQSPPSEEQQEE